MSTATEQFFHSTAVLFLLIALGALQIVCVEQVQKGSVKIISAAMLRACIVVFLSIWTFAYLERFHGWSWFSLGAIFFGSMLAFSVLRMSLKLRVKKLSLTMGRSSTTLSWIVFLSIWTLAYLETFHRWNRFSVGVIFIGSMLVFSVLQMVVKLRVKISLSSATPSPRNGEGQ